MESEDDIAREQAVESGETEAKVVKLTHTCIHTHTHTYTHTETHYTLHTTPTYTCTHTHTESILTQY